MPHTDHHAGMIPFHITMSFVIGLFPVLAHFARDLRRGQSSMSFKVRFSMLIQFLVLLCAHSTHLCLDHSFFFTIKALMLAEMGLGLA